jgi:hypothetical protein
MLIHCPSCLGAAATTQTAEVACGDGMSTMWTAERSRVMLHFDGVISHIFKCSRISEQGSEPKLLWLESASINMTGERVGRQRCRDVPSKGHNGSSPALFRRRLAASTRLDSGIPLALLSFSQHGWRLVPHRRPFFTLARQLECVGRRMRRAFFVVT